MDIQQMLELLRKESRAEREAAEKRADVRFKAWRGKSPHARKAGRRNGSHPRRNKSYPSND
jgi:hypothetical protein